MQVPRIYVDQDLSLGQTVCLSGQQHHHIAHVLRVSKGQKVQLFNGRGQQFLCCIDAIRRRELDLTCEEVSEAKDHSRVVIDLCIAVARRASMDFAIQKATELGVRKIQPMITRHSQQVPSAARAARQMHWQKIAMGAAEQCGRTSIPIVADITPLNALPHTEMGAAYILLPAAQKQFVTALQERTDLTVPATAQVFTLMIGPEGDFAQSDLQTVQAWGIECVQMGPRILRVETAVIAAMSIVHAVCGDFSG